ncbi:hypothetical protein LTR10_004158 [Elasticomyces elasticus]|nr:hypothetical protein LTR10_004158 [Elasticomyces elasticus]KAK4977658.1 hypothetical protein LTR42_002029 [Elasticomyces elasticus]
MTALKVLSLPELLEPILFDLSTRDLLFAQKVCKTWHEVIASTPSLQKALFFVRSSEAEFCKTTTIPAFACGRALLANSLLIRTYRSGDVTVRGACFDFQRRPLHAGAESSCHRMYLTQPPTVLESFWRRSRLTSIPAPYYRLKSATRHNSGMTYEQALEFRRNAEAESGDWETDSDYEWD